jgi:SAM-dependent methyltransferase
VAGACGLLACAESPPPRCPEPAEHPPAGAGHGSSRADKGHGHDHGRHEGGPLVHRFGEAEAWEQRFEGPERDAYQKPQALVRAMAIEPGMRVADIGAGTGYFLPHLAAAVGSGGRIEAVDIEPAMVRHMIARTERDGLDNVIARLAVVDDPLLRPVSLDRILIVNTWHHIPNRDAYAEKLARGLVAAGEVWIVDFALESPRGPAREHKLEPEDAAKSLSRAGLEVAIDRELLPDQWVVVGRKILEGG